MHSIAGTNHPQVAPSRTSFPGVQFSSSLFTPSQISAFPRLSTDCLLSRIVRLFTRSVTLTERTWDQRKLMPPAAVEGALARNPSTLAYAFVILLCFALLHLSQTVWPQNPFPKVRWFCPHSSDRMLSCLNQILLHPNLRLRNSCAHDWNLSLSGEIPIHLAFSVLILSTRPRDAAGRYVSAQGKRSADPPTGSPLRNVAP